MPVIFEQKDSLRAARRDSLGRGGRQGWMIADEGSTRDDLVYSASSAVRRASGGLPLDHSARRLALGDHSAPSAAVRGHGTEGGVRLHCSGDQHPDPHVSHGPGRSPAAGKGKTGFVIFEIARSEIDYTKQRPPYTRRPSRRPPSRLAERSLFIQGDHSR
jgi:hypothetical protein